MRLNNMTARHAQKREVTEFKYGCGARLSLGKY